MKGRQIMCNNLQVKSKILASLSPPNMMWLPPPPYPHFFSLPPSFTLLQPLWFPHCHSKISNIFPPQGLCICCYLHLLPSDLCSNVTSSETSTQSKIVSPRLSTPLILLYASSQHIHHSVCVCVCVCVSSVTLVVSNSF